jgi:putative transposase
MSHTFTQLLYHLAFTTKYRAGLIGPELQGMLFPYIAGIVRQERASLLAIGGMPDHLHLLVRSPPTLSIADLLRVIKTNSSRWAREDIGTLPEFAWQEGYGAFSVSESSAASVCRYIQNQEEHHRRRTFEEEWGQLLRRHGIGGHVVRRCVPSAQGSRPGLRICRPTGSKLSSSTDPAR